RAVSPVPAESSTELSLHVPPRAPRSTLFPYTTLFRSRGRRTGSGHLQKCPALRPFGRRGRSRAQSGRSALQDSSAFLAPVVVFQLVVEDDFRELVRVVSSGSVVVDFHGRRHAVDDRRVSLTASVVSGERPDRALGTQCLAPVAVPDDVVWPTPHAVAFSVSL